MEDDSHEVEPFQFIDDQEFDVELERRAEELRAEPSSGIPWEVVREMR